MLLLSPFVDVMRMFMSTESFHTQLDSWIVCLQNAFLWPMVWMVLILQFFLWALFLSLSFLYLCPFSFVFLVTSCLIVVVQPYMEWNSIKKGALSQGVDDIIWSCYFDKSQYLQLWMIHEPWNLGSRHSFRREFHFEVVLLQDNHY